MESLYFNLLSKESLYYKRESLGYDVMLHIEIIPVLSFAETKF